MSNIAEELAKLHGLKGAEFIIQLKAIVARNEFHPLKDDPYIYTTGGENHGDYQNLLAAARKAVNLGYKVFILPNPDDTRSADYIFVRKGVFKLYDLKTIFGKTSVDNRLVTSLGQTNRVLLNITSNYNPSSLARSIKRYFEKSDSAIEVLVFRGRKMVSVTRDLTRSPNYYQLFMKRYLNGK